jgi:hypothetical protein
METERRGRRPVHKEMQIGRPMDGQQTAEPNHRLPERTAFFPFLRRGRKVTFFPEPKIFRLSRRLAGRRPAGRRRRALHKTRRQIDGGFRWVGERRLCQIRIGINLAVLIGSRHTRARDPGGRSSALSPWGQGGLTDAKTSGRTERGGISQLTRGPQVKRKGWGSGEQRHRRADRSWPGADE